MRPASNGLSATLLLLVPLLAVPFLAAIGLPQFSASPAAANVEQPDLRPAVEHDTAVGRNTNEDRAARPPRPSADDLFAPFDGLDAPAAETSPDEPVSLDAGDRRARVLSRLASAPSREPVVRSDAFDSDPPTVADQPAGPEPRMGQPLQADLTWSAAVRRMGELGIDDFALSPGDGENQFHFRCHLAVPGDPGVTHRFEAEAAEPLAAVAVALGQVDAWLNQTPQTAAPFETARREASSEARLARLADSPAAGE